jgi:A/G-specific adenine glycosylase
MDIGATICRPVGPSCAACPLHASCRAQREGAPERYPGKKLRAAPKPLRMAFAWCDGEAGVLLEQRALDGLWPGLWELPSATGPTARRSLGQRLGGQLEGPLVKVTHTLTHRHVTAAVYRAAIAPAPGQRWWTDPLAAPLSALARKAIVAVRGGSRGEPASTDEEARILAP